MSNYQRSPISRCFIQLAAQALIDHQNVKNYLFNMETLHPEILVLLPLFSIPYLVRPSPDVHGGFCVTVQEAEAEHGDHNQTNSLMNGTLNLQLLRLCVKTRWRLLIITFNMGVGGLDFICWPIRF